MRTEDCTHIQTFDLHSAIFSIATSDMLKKVNLWKAITASPSGKGYVVPELWYENNFCCPVCRHVGPLYVDLTVAAALACLPASVSRVAFSAPFSSSFILIILTPILVQPDARVLAMGGGEKANFQRDEIRHGEHVPGDCNVNFDYNLHDPVSRRRLYVVRY